LLWLREKKEETIKVIKRPTGKVDMIYGLDVEVSERRNVGDFMILVIWLDRL